MADNNAVLQRLSQELTDKGKLIEAGFVGLRIACMSPASPPDQIREMRMAFMAGAQHLFSSIMTILEPGDEPTAADMRRLDIIGDELAAFGREIEAKLTTKGSA